MAWVGFATLVLATAYVSTVTLSPAQTARTGSISSSGSASGFHLTVTNISVGTGPVGAIYDPLDEEILVANSGSNNLSVIHGTSVVRSISGQSGALLLQLDPSNGFVYVWDEGANMVSVFNGSTLKLVHKVLNVTTYRTCPRCATGASTFLSQLYDPANGDIYLAQTQSGSTFSELSRLPSDAPWKAQTLVLGNDTRSVTYDPATLDLVATNAASDNLSVVNSSTNVVTTVDLAKGSDPVASVYDNRSGDLDVVDAGASTPPNYTRGDVSVLGPLNTIVKTIPVGKNPYGGTYDPANGCVYVANYTFTSSASLDGALVVISASNALVHTFALHTAAGLPVFDPANSELYEPEPYANSTVVINSSTDSIATTVATVGQVESAFFDPVGNYVVEAFGLTSASPTVLAFLSSPTSGHPKLVGELVIGEDPVGLACSPNRCYTTNNASNTVSEF